MKKILSILIVVCICGLVLLRCGSNQASWKDDESQQANSTRYTSTNAPDDTEEPPETESDSITDKYIESENNVITDEASDSEDMDFDGNEFENEPTRENSTSSDGIRPEFKEALDSYEVFFDEYIAFMQKYSSSDDALSMLTDYVNYMTRYAETMEKLSSLDTGEMSAEEAAYYAEVSARIAQKLLAVEL